VLSVHKEGERHFNSSTFTLALVGLVLLITIILSLASLISLQRGRHRALAESATHAQNLCLVLGDNLSETYEKINLQLQVIKDEVERSAISRPSETARLDSILRLLKARVPALEGIWVIDRDGIITHGPGLKTDSRVDISDRDYFQRLKANPEAGLVTSTPVIGRITRSWILLVSRRINRPDGSFGGIVSAAVSLDYLTRLFAAVDLGREGSISLRNLNQVILVRHAGPQGAESMVGKAAPFPELQKRIQQGHASGAFTALSRVDHVARNYAFLRLPGKEQLLLVGLGKNESLADWRREVQLTATFAGGLLLLTLSFAWVVNRAWRRQRMAMEALNVEKSRYQSIFMNAFEGIWRMSLDGSISQVNPAFARAWGYASQEDMMAEIKKIRDLPSDQEGQLAELERKLIKTGRIDGLEAKGRKKDGTHAWFLVHAHLVRTPDGKPAYFEGMTIDISERKAAELERERLILELKQALAEVKALSGLLPICSYCKNIRDDQGYWNQIEAYISTHSDAHFTHGICPECAKSLFPDAYGKLHPPTPPSGGEKEG